ncbi:carboxylesterase [Sphingomonas sp. Leaf24]|uniref:carboxylesterase/lipase family protein n=1 Tax=unclassified Sphingomonas TaxID=196159 RepID=UPI0006F1DCD5|nr:MULTISPECIES: carboxylesterase family protein [unclassified Sphingomonas]KQM21181.1 carboxylesterase [Sphingomonas sp. Leaf5]KQM89729.1 carboxylesterase [Sphingomonas sp. Leaf24]
MNRIVNALIVATALTAIPAAAQPAGPTVRTVDGAVRGQATDGVESWKGIPFAAPPVGPLRWRAPQPAAKWTGVRDATQYSSDCMQKPFPSDAAPLGTTPAEDCLYANVWRPAGAKGKLPVLVWIYGGGFVNGGASPPTYAGANMAKKGMVFVSFNYRLGRFGTFALPQLTAQNADGGRLGNYGIMDQVAALQWVKRNVAAFGGDPANVTISGESAGGISVHALVTSPEAKGLFNKAVVMSGGDAKAFSPNTLADVEKIGGNFAKTKGIDPAAPDALQRLRALSAEDVLDGLNMAQMSGRGAAPTNSGPFVDGKVVVDLRKAYEQGNFARVPMMIGATSADIGGKSGFMIAGGREASAMIADKGVPVWEYRFSYVADSVGQGGAQHATDIPYFFDNTRIKYGAQTTAKDEGVGRAMSGYLGNFVKRGDPNGGGLPGWPRYTRASDTLADFAADGKVVVARDPWGADIDRLSQALAAAKASGRYTTLTTPIGELLDNPATRAVLERHVPAFLKNPQLDMARGTTLYGLQTYLPDQFTDPLLATIDRDLATVPVKK